MAGYNLGTCSFVAMQVICGVARHVACQKRPRRSGTPAYAACALQLIPLVSVVSVSLGLSTHSALASTNGAIA